MFVHLLVTGWLLSPLVTDQVAADPGFKGPVPTAPVQTVAPVVQFKPGRYAPEALQAPEVIPMERFDEWVVRPHWPAVATSVVVVVPHKDPSRFVAFLVDVGAHRLIAIREGDRSRHLEIIGDVRTQEQPSSDGSTLGRIDRGTGVVIVVSPPKPVGPGGIPTDLVARVLDVARLTAEAQQWFGATQAGPVR